jgi:hypothetical protein
MQKGHSRLGFTGGKVNFTDTQTTMMRSDGDKDVCIYRIRTFHNLSLPLSVGGNPVASPAQVQNAFLTLYILGNEQLNEISLTSMLDQQNALADDFNPMVPFYTAPLRVDWTNSFVEFAAPGADDTPAYSFVFEFEYEWLPVGSIAAYLQIVANKRAAGMLE